MSNLTLRALKGSALTYAEMDANFTSTFIGAEVDGNVLRLFKQDPNDSANCITHAFTLPTGGGTTVTPGDTDPAGSDQHIQFNDNGVFGSNSKLLYNKASNILSIGESSTDANYALNIGSQGNNTGILVRQNNSSGTAKISFKRQQTVIGEVGKVASGSDSFLINANSGVAHLQAAGTTNILLVSECGGRVLLGSSSNSHTSASDKKRLNVIGSGIAIHSTLGSTPSVLSNITQGTNLSVNTATYLGNSSTNGLLLQSTTRTDQTGNIVIGLSTDTSNTNAFAVIGAKSNDYSTGCATTALVAKADGRVGINKNGNSLSTIYTLSVGGGIWNDGNTDLDGTLNVEGEVTIQAGLTGSSTLNENYSGTAIETLVKKSDESIVAIPAAPIPLGGIIMWSGAIANIPTGWKLCDGQTHGGITTPNLEDRFVIGAGNTYAPDEIGGNNTTTLISDNIPAITAETTCVGSHNHYVVDSCTKADSGTCSLWDGDVTQAKKNRPLAAVGCNVGGANFAYELATVSGQADAGLTSNSGNHCHSVTIGSQNPTAINTLPKYYALAFIMYTGN